MKKILLIITIALCIFQVVVLATDIDIGTPAINRSSSAAGSYTMVAYENPANETGKITSVEIWANTDLTNVEVAIFYVISGTNLSTRDYETIGNVTAGSKQSFDVNLDVVTGDYIGIYWASSGERIESSAATGDELYKQGDYIPCTDAIFDTYDETISLYGTAIVDIDIGSPAIERASSAAIWTIIAKDNPANLSGVINSVEIYAGIGDDLVNCEVATFFVVSGNNLSTRDTEYIGAVTGGSKQTFSGLNLTCEVGDYIGIYYTAGRLAWDNFGGYGTWGLSNTDAIPCTNLTFDSFDDEIMSLYGTGTIEVAGEEANATFFGTPY